MKKTSLLASLMLGTLLQTSSLKATLKSELAHLINALINLELMLKETPPPLPPREEPAVPVPGYFPLPLPYREAELPSRRQIRPGSQGPSAQKPTAQPQQRSQSMYGAPAQPSGLKRFQGDPKASAAIRTFVPRINNLLTSQNPQEDTNNLLFDFKFYAQQNTSFPPADVELFNRMLDRLIEINPTLRIEAEELKK